MARTTLPFEHISDESLDGEGLGEMSKARRSFLGMECITLKELKASCWPPPGLVVRVKHIFKGWNGKGLREGREGGREGERDGERGVGTAKCAVCFAGRTCRMSHI